MNESGAGWGNLPYTFPTWHYFRNNMSLCEQFPVASPGMALSDAPGPLTDTCGVCLALSYINPRLLSGGLPSPPPASEDSMTNTDQVVVVKAAPGMTDEQLDELVAVHIMGLIPGKDFGTWERHEWQQGPDGKPDPYAWDNDYGEGYKCLRCDHYGDEEDLDDTCQIDPAQYAHPSFYKDLERVMVRLRALEWGISVTYQSTTYFALVSRPGQRSGGFNAQDENLARAVCVAGLRALGVLPQ